MVDAAVGVAVEDQVSRLELLSRRDTGSGVELLLGGTGQRDSGSRVGGLGEA